MSAQRQPWKLEGSGTLPLNLPRLYY
jgi:hypothetical protein